MAHHQKSTKDRIETVIFTPMTCYSDQPVEYARERTVSYEDMEELKEKLFSMYEDEESNELVHVDSSPQQERDALETSFFEREEPLEDLRTPTKANTPPHLRSILKTKPNHNYSIHPIPLPPTPDHTRKASTTPPSDGSIKQAKKRFVRFFSGDDSKHVF